jgi:hypothetical protein
LDDGLMKSLLASVGSFVGGATLAWAGLAHIRRRRQLQEALERQSVWPDRTNRVVANIVTSIELLLASACLGAILSDSVHKRLALLGVTALYTLFALYALFLLHRRPNAPCGCDTLSTPATNWTVVRACTLATACVIGALWPDAIVSPLDPDPRLSFVLLAALSLALIVWSLPASFSNPESAADEAHSEAHDELL